MFELFSGLSTGVAVSLIFALFFVLAYEFINGFHDTANAVATVIYTKAMPPHLAVVVSGICNFIGVMVSGLGVAYAIVHLLPMDLLLNVGSTHGLIMVFSLLTAAIVWNFGTWYLGLPASSSHTLIGSILGVGLANAWLAGLPLAQGINTKKAIDVMLALIVSPVVGLLFAAVLFLLLKRFRAQSRMHKTPEERKQVDGKKHPPFWTRLMLVLSSMGVSYAHGSNDGQKGVGLVMLVLIGIVPSKFVLDLSATSYEIARTRDAAAHMQQYYAKHAAQLSAVFKPSAVPKTTHGAACDAAAAPATLQELIDTLHGIDSYSKLAPDTRLKVRRMVLCLDDTAKKVAKSQSLKASEQADLNILRKDLLATTEYAPQWVIVAVALALGIGTMIGWKRVVVTVGEKIGNRQMTYAQGLAAQTTAAIGITFASATGMPVSTTHVLSSAVAGTMLSGRSGLQGSTVRNILLAWFLTLPATIFLAGGLFLLASKLLA